MPPPTMIFGAESSRGTQPRGYALVGSTDQLAAMGDDLNAFMRLLARGSSPEIECYRAGLLSLADDVRSHLALAALLLAELKSARKSR